MAGFITLPQHRNPWMEQLPQFVQQMAFQSIGHKFQAKQLQQEQDFRKQENEKQRKIEIEAGKLSLDQSGYVEVDAERPDVMYGGSGYKRPSTDTKFVDLGNGMVAPVTTQTRYGQQPQVSKVGSITKGAENKLQRNVKYFTSGGKLFAQPVAFDQLSGTEKPVGEAYPTESRKANVKVGVSVGTKGMAKLAEKMSEGLVEEMKTAEGAQAGFQNLIRTEQILNSGIITGTGATWLLAAGKALEQAGIKLSPDAISNTQAYQAMMGKQVGEIIKQFGSGTGLSDADREYAERIAGGDISATKESLQKIVALNKKAYTAIISKYNARANEVMSRPGADQLPYDLILNQTTPSVTELKPLDSYWKKP
jgi:hypothetical protein